MCAEKSEPVSHSFVRKRVQQPCMAGGQLLDKKLPPGRCKAPSSVSQDSNSPSPNQICAGRHLGGGLSRGGPARFGLWLVGVSRLGARGAQGVPSLASLLKIALVPGGLCQHLHPPLLVLLQASPELRTLPFTFQLSGKAKDRETQRAVKKPPFFCKAGSESD